MCRPLPVAQQRRQVRSSLSAPAQHAGFVFSHQLLELPRLRRRQHFYRSYLFVHPSNWIRHAAGFARCRCSISLHETRPNPAILFASAVYLDREHAAQADRKFDAWLTSPCGIAIDPQASRTCQPPPLRCSRFQEALHGCASDHRHNREAQGQVQGRSPRSEPELTSSSLRLPKWLGDIAEEYDSLLARKGSVMISPELEERWRPWA